MPAFDFMGRRTPGNDLNPYAVMVETELRKFGINVEQARLRVENGFGWTFPHGSATIEVYIGQQENTGRGFLQVLSPIVHLPVENLMSLYRRLLEENLRMSNAAFGVYLDIVFVFDERPLDGLNPVEIQDIVTLVANYADDMDDQLVREFGGRLFRRI